MVRETAIKVDAQLQSMLRSAAAITALPVVRPAGTVTHMAKAEDMTTDLAILQCREVRILVVAGEDRKTLVSLLLAA